MGGAPDGGVTRMRPQRCRIEVPTEIPQSECSPGPSASKPSQPASQMSPSATHDQPFEAAFQVSPEVQQLNQKSIFALMAYTVIENAKILADIEKACYFMQQRQRWECSLPDDVWRQQTQFQSKVAACEDGAARMKLKADMGAWRRNQCRQLWRKSAWEALSFWLCGA